MSKDISTGIQCCKCLRILGIDFKRRIIKEVYCLRCAKEELKEGEE